MPPCEAEYAIDVSEVNDAIILLNNIQDKANLSPDSRQ